MSSFIGIYGQDQAKISQIEKLVSPTDFSFQSHSLSIFANGSSLNTHFNSDPKANAGWIACGIAISNEDEPTILDTRTWQAHLQKDPEHHKNLNGHFALAKWNENTLELYTDQLGMRNIFLHKSEGAILFSTRLDWLISLIPGLSINWKEFGSNWLSINPFSSSCFVNEIERLGQGGYAKISENELKFSNKRWSPEPVQANLLSAENTLRGSSLAALKGFPKISLGLSGGLDSRVLLALLVNENSSSFNAYTFTKDKHPDEKIARQLSSAYDLEHTLFPLQKLDNDHIIALLSETGLRSMLSTSVFELEALQAYKLLGKQKAITIDGAFGEIGRRRYLRSIELKSSKAVYSKSVLDLLPLFSTSKADIFSEEVLKEMKMGFKEEFESEIEAMPDAKETGVGNWLDLFAIRSRAQNLYGLKQEYTDELLFHYMPFLQPGFLHLLFGLPEKERRNAFLFKNIIRRNAPKLTLPKLVKGDDTYPYWMKDISSMVWMKTKRKFGAGHKTDSDSQMVLQLEPFLRDIFSSQAAKQNPFYEYKKIDSLLKGFFEEKNYSLASQIGWLLSFEVFREKL